MAYVDDAFFTPAPDLVAGQGRKMLSYIIIDNRSGRDGGWPLGESSPWLFRRPFWDDPRKLDRGSSTTKASQAVPNPRISE